MGSRSKEAVVILVDAGPSMSASLRERAALKSPSGETASRFDAARAAVESVIQQKLFFKPKDEIGIVLYGTEVTSNQLNDDQGGDEYANVRVLASIDTPTLSMCEKLRGVAPSPVSADVKVDLLDGLIVALDLIFRRTDGQKYDKRLLVITDAASKIQDAADVEPVVEMIQNMDVKLQIVGIDFLHTTDKDPVKDEPENVAMDVKRKNEKMLVSIAREVHGDVASATKRMHMLAQGMKKTVMLTTKFRGPLEMGAGFGIPLYCFLKTKTATLPTLAKESQVSHEKGTSGKVKLDRRFTSPQNPDEEVRPDQQVKAYRYGVERVPFSSADVDFFKFQTEKSLKLLGFVDKSQVSWSKFIGGTDVFVAEPNKPNAAKALAALVEGMLELDHVAVARFVPRKNAAPKIIALIPHRPTHVENFYALWGQQLPYDEDIRTYEFAPLKTKKYTPTEQQQTLADKLVESLSVKDDKALEVGSSFNPVIRRFFHAVEERAFNENASVPPIPADLEASLKMDQAREQRIADIIQGFGDAFQLKEAVKKQGERKKKAFWSDVKTEGVEGASGDGDGDQGLGGGGDDDGDDGGSDIDLDELLDGGDVTSVGAMNPIADFETLVEMGKSNRTRLHAAVTGMQSQISKFFEGGNSAFFPKAVQCLAHFRKRSVEILYASEFNDFLTQLKISVGGEDSSAWTAVKNEGITLLTTQDDPTLKTTQAQARAFLYGDEKEIDLQIASASLSSQVEAIENDDDMFADFE